MCRIARSRRQDLKKIDIPVRVLRGDDDEIVPSSPPASSW